MSKVWQCATQRVNRYVTALISLLALACATAAHAQAPVELFAETPAVRAVELSPNGEKVAFLNHIEGEDFLVILDLASGSSTTLARVTQLRARDISFVSDDYIVLVVSRTTGNFWVRGRWEQSAAFSVNVETGETVQLLTRTEGIYPYQSGLGRIIGVSPDRERVYMPAYMGDNSDRVTRDLVSVRLSNGRGTQMRGTGARRDTIDWLVDDQGEIIAREDLNAAQAHHEIRSYARGSSEVIYRADSPLISTSLVGSLPDNRLVTVDASATGFLSVFTMSPTTGEQTGPILHRDNADVDDVITDINRRVLGVRYTGMRPTYEMFDEGLTAAIAHTQDALPNSSIWLDSWSADHTKLLFFVEGGDVPERYVLHDRTDNSVKTIMNRRPGITPEQVGEVVEMHYYARDDLQIPGVLTWPAGIAEADRTNLPMIILPHGGPEAFDGLGWDWLSQFLVNQGYLVLQPNFRGSAGFGLDFRDAGRGQWGRKMQDDITDGVDGLISTGWVDPERICIVGWSYGGYAALMGGASTPEKYKCVASIAGVSDLCAMLRHERATQGPESPALAYWQHLIGDIDRDRAAIDAVSPIHLASGFTAPVLLIHGTDDTVVEETQSSRMERALTAAGKEVTYLRIDADDHSLSRADSRIEALNALAAFLSEHLGSN